MRPNRPVSPAFVGPVPVQDNDVGKHLLDETHSESCRVTATGHQVGEYPAWTGSAGGKTTCRIGARIPVSLGHCLCIRERSLLGLLGERNRLTPRPRVAYTADIGSLFGHGPHSDASNPTTLDSAYCHQNGCSSIRIGLRYRPGDPFASKSTTVSRDRLSVRPPGERNRLRHDVRFLAVRLDGTITPSDISKWS